MVQVRLGLRSLSVVLFEPCTDFLKMQTVVAAYSCCSIMPQVRWFKTTGISSLTFLEARSRRSRCSLAMLSLKALEKGLSSSCLFLFPDSPWCSNLCLHLQVSFSLSLCLCFSFFSSVQFSSVAQSCLTLCDTMDSSTPGFLVHHQLPEFAQTHVHQVGDAIQLILCRPFLLPPSIFTSIRIFSKESVLCIT